MSHALDMTRGRAAMAFTGEVPWHGLGARLSEGSPLEVWQQEAGLDWEARKAVVQFGREALDLTNGQSTTVLTKDSQNCVLYRSDSGLPLSIVSSRYQPVQPREIIEFYRDLTERHGFAMETAGAIKEGRKIWALANCHKALTLPGNDHLRGYLLLATSFDGSMATQARFTSVRVVCNNTLTAAVQGRADVSVRHNTTFDADSVKMDLNVGDAWAAFSERCREMSETGVRPADQVRLLMNAYHGLATDEAIAHAKEDPRKEKSLEQFMERMASILANAPGSNLQSARNTLWGVVNAVTYDIDHEGRARTKDNRLDSAWFGKGESIKQRIMQCASNFLAQAA